MSVRSGALIQSTSSGAFQYAAGTVGIGTAWIVKDVRVTNQSGGALAAHVYILAAANATQVTLLDVINLAASATSSWQGWVALQPGDQVLFNPGGASLHLWVSGAVLPGHI